MSRVSPTIEGFRAAFRRPSVTFAEISWRWVVGATAWALILFSFFEYLNTLPVTRRDALLLSTRQPAFINRAVAHILRGSLNRVVIAILLGGIALSLLWALAASLGRKATVRALLEYFHGEVWPADATEMEEGHPRPFRSLLVVNGLRLAVMLAATLAFVGAAILVGFTSTVTHPRPGLAFVLFLPLAGLICTAWSGLSWLLSLAGIFAVRDGDDVLSSLSSAADFARDRTGAVFAVSAWTGLAHLVAFSVATTAVALPLNLIRIAPPRLVVAIVLVITLVYFAVADWLYMARLAGYLCICEMPPVVPVIMPPAPLPPGEDVFRAAAIDREELILSDVPGLA
jgi:hypothetical protein